MVRFPLKERLGVERGNVRSSMWPYSVQGGLGHSPDSVPKARVTGPFVGGITYTLVIWRPFTRRAAYIPSSPPSASSNRQQF